MMPCQEHHACNYHIFHTDRVGFSHKDSEFAALWHYVGQWTHSNEIKCDSAGILTSVYFPQNPKVSGHAIIAMCTHYRSAGHI